MDFKDKVVVITGGAQGIGRCIAEEFLKAGAAVCVIDKQQGKAAIKRAPTNSFDWQSESSLGEANHFVGNLADKHVLEQFAQDVIEKHGQVDYLINNALPLFVGCATNWLIIYQFRRKW